jgi:tetratricopeptide (TPR) repeat protein
MHAYGTRDLERLLGIPVSAVRTLVRAGHVKPRKAAGGRLQFSFQDLIILRTARALSRAKFSARKVNRCLRQLRAALPASMPLSGLSIAAVGDRVAVREGRERWDTESGQYLLALEVGVEAGEIRLIAREGTERQVSGRQTRRSGQAARGDGEDDSVHYELAYALEETDPVAAIEAYQRCLAANKDHSRARANCGRLLHLAGRLVDAEAMYRRVGATDATLLFNLAVLLEDAGREDEAVQVYRDALSADPGFADAHFNLARLHERAGNSRDSFRHLLAYKRLSERA